MRKFNSFAGMMPRDLVEFEAHIVNDCDGEHCKGDEFQACRFGYAIRWCDGSGETAFIPEESLEEAIKRGKEQLAKKGWVLSEEQYTGQEITEEIIEKYTKEMVSTDTLRDEFKRYLNLWAACMEQPWFDVIRDAVNQPPGIYNINSLPDSTRENSNVSLINFNRELGVMLLRKAGESVDDDHIEYRSYSTKYETIDEAKVHLGLPIDCPDITAVNALVTSMERRENEFRKELHDYAANLRKNCIELFDEMTMYFNNYQKGIMGFYKLHQLVAANMFITGNVSRHDSRINNRCMADFATDAPYMDYSSMKMYKQTTNGGLITEVIIPLNASVVDQVKDCKKRYQTTLKSDSLDSHFHKNIAWSEGDTVMHIIYGFDDDGQPVIYMDTDNSMDAEILAVHKPNTFADGPIVEDVDYEGYENAEDKD